MDKEIKELAEFEAAVERICEFFEIPPKNKIYTVRSGLPGFIRILMKKIPNNQINGGNIAKYINTFINDYKSYKNKDLFTWDIQAWLNHVHFESDLAIGKFLFRKPHVNDLSITRQRSQHIAELDRLTSRVLQATCILEFPMVSPKQTLGIYSDDIRNEFESILDVLRLFKVGNISTSRLSVEPRSVLESGYTESLRSSFDTSWKDKIEPQHTSNYSYEIFARENAEFARFFSRMKPILKRISPKNYLSGNYLDLAFHRYKDSLLRSEVNVNRIVSAFSCLEALLSNSQSEITFKISIHVAALLRHFGFIGVKVLKKMKLAYSIRSKVLHGTKLDSKLMTFSKNHTHEIVNYARICLLVSLQLKNVLGKDSLIEAIDHSLVDSKSSEEFLKTIEAHTFIPVIYPFRKLDLLDADDFSLSVQSIGTPS